MDLSSREIAVLLTLLVYQVSLLAIGLVCRGKTHDNLDFYLGGRRLGPLVAAISASASSSSAWTLLGVSGAAYAWGFSALWLFPSCVGGFLLNWLLLARPLRKYSVEEDALTVTDVLAGKPGSSGHSAINVISSLIVLASLGTYISSQFQGAGKTFSETFGLSMPESILLGSLIVVFYTLMGGFWAVSVTDTLQGLLMAATSIVLPAAALHAVGGWSGFLDGIRAINDPSFFNLFRDMAWPSAIGFVLGLLGIGLGYPGQPHVVNRFMALSEKPGSLEKARFIAISWAVVVYAGMLTVGLCGRILLPNLSDPEIIFIGLTNSLFPPVMSGIMLAAVLSAIMSTADSQLLVASSTVTHDLGLEKIRRLSPLTWSRLVVLTLSTIAVGGALVGSQQIFSRVLFAWAAMGSAFGPILLVLVYRNQIRPGYRIAGLLIGFGFSVGAFLVMPAALPWKGAFERVLPFVLTFLVAWIGSEADFHAQASRLDFELNSDFEDFLDRQVEVAGYRFSIAEHQDKQAVPQPKPS